MFGNKYSGDSIASAMFDLLNSSAPQTKTASDKSGEVENSPTLQSEATVKPEDFLISPVGEIEEVGAAIDSKIVEVSSYAEDDLCPEHKTEKDECGCSGGDVSHVADGMSAGALLAEDLSAAEDGEQADDGPTPPDDFSYLMDSKARTILEGLGKVAGSLRAKNEGFAADLVEATAKGIKDDLLKEAAEKVYVVNSLCKMATEFYNDGNALAGDMVSVTIGKIKKG